MLFNRECPRCSGTGRFDRGTCFQCKGSRFIKQKNRPSLPSHVIEVKFENGTKNVVTMFSSRREHAVSAIELQCADKGWKAIVTPALFM